jgi:hypothetical protein
MTTKTREEVIAKAKPTEGMPSMGTVRAAANAAAEVYAQDEMEKHAQVILDAWVAKLKEQTRVYTRATMAQVARASEPVAAGGEEAELAGITSTAPFLPPYAWFDLFCAGPFQFAPGAAFLPHKVIRAGEPSFMLGVLWRNPAPINFIVGNPSAADMMAALNFSVWFETVNLTSVTDGPDFGPFVFSPIGGGFINAFFAPLTFAAPPSGKPNLYEVNMTVDVTGPGIVPATLPFSGFATWQFDPDFQPPTLVPGTIPSFKQDIPARFLVHS